MSVNEAEAKGIDVNRLEKVDAASDTVSPAGSQPPAAGVAALDEKLADMKMDPATSTTSKPSEFHVQLRELNGMNVQCGGLMWF